MSVDKQRENRESITGNKETYGRGEHPNSKANLTPFKECVSCNQSGRPFKYVGLANALKEAGKTPPYDFEYIPPTYRLAVIHKIWEEASRGSIQHIKILAELGCLDDE